MVSLEFRAPQIKAAFGRAVATRRDALGLTQEELSDRCGIAAKSISCTECGKGNLTYFNLKRLSAGLQMSASELLACAEGIEEAKALDAVKLPAADPPQKSAKMPAQPRETVRERRSKRETSVDSAEKS